MFVRQLPSVDSREIGELLPMPHHSTCKGAEVNWARPFAGSISTKSINSIMMEREELYQAFFIPVCWKNRFLGSIKAFRTLSDLADAMY